MRQILLILSLFFVFLSFGQVEQNKEERRVAPATNNNVLKETEESLDIRELKKSKSISVSQKKVIQLESVSNELATTLQQASRMNDRKSYTKTQKEKLQNGVEKIEKLDKESFEYHLYSYLQSPYNFKNIQSLEKAEKLNAYDFTVLTSFTAYHKIKGNDEELKSYLSKLYQGKYFSEDLLNYASLTLLSLPQNAVLITNGKNDTYPLLIQQKIKNTRSDVEIISLDHLLSIEYRKKLKNKGFNMPARNTIDTEYFDQFIQMNSEQNIIAANSLPKPYLSKLQVDLVVVGLGISAYPEKNVNKTNRSFYETELKQALPVLIRSEYRVALGNSLPLLFDVRNTYIEQGLWSEKNEIEKWIIQIGAITGKSSQINILLK